MYSDDSVAFDYVTVTGNYGDAQVFSQGTLTSNRSVIVDPLANPNCMVSSSSGTYNGDPLESS